MSPPPEALSLNQSVSQPDSTFLYFAFGSNLYQDRIQINSPSAKLVGICKLSGYKLEFTGYSKFWSGAVATILKHDNFTKNDSSENDSAKNDSAKNDLAKNDFSKNSFTRNDSIMNNKEVWGALWEISYDNLKNLDDQEGVHISLYKPIEVIVEALFFDKNPFLREKLDLLCLHTTQKTLDFVSHDYKFESDLTNNQCISKKKNCTPTFDSSLKLQLLSKYQDMRQQDQLALLQLKRAIDHLTTIPLPNIDTNKFKFQKVSVRTYQKIEKASIPVGLPSDTYKLVILKGAIACNLPLYYLKYLSNLESNQTCSTFAPWKITKSQ